MIVIGLYAVLWGKHKENKEKELVEEEEEIPEVVKSIRTINGKTILVVGDIEATAVELEKSEANNKLSAVSIAMPMPESPVKPNQHHK